MVRELTCFTFYLAIHPSFSLFLDLIGVYEVQGNESTVTVRTKMMVLMEVFTEVMSEFVFFSFLKGESRLQIINVYSVYTDVATKIKDDRYVWKLTPSTEITKRKCNIVSLLNTN